ncbi:hypothetical protein CORC01_03927 [Colletotrichum orchidophilum]|uniref:Uncharacterized protein n=1 Tax=Colletotrichum orchidophilum TaxID=1209926 RepID=A0A1G4BHP4_9PEZI|nr:uncharacterized protein CORC01_03927 [Colletotrichum orchidophilum]OHF00853.1 hypothetical protein CORC01_03927 [Colletotrichum orchidophilum]
MTMRLANTKPVTSFRSFTCKPHSMNLGSDSFVSPLGQSPHTLRSSPRVFIFSRPLSRGSANIRPSDRILFVPFIGAGVMGGGEDKT